MVKVSSDYIMTESGRVNIGLGQNRKLILLVNSCECELFLMVFLIDIEKNVCSRIMASYRVPEAILICSSKYTTYGMAAAKGLSLG